MKVCELMNILVKCNDTDEVYGGYKRDGAVNTSELTDVILVKNLTGEDTEVNSGIHLFFGGDCYGKKHKENIRNCQ